MIMLCEACGMEMDPMTHLRENCLENQCDNLDSQLTQVHARLEALEKWGREVVKKSRERGGCSLCSSKWVPHPYRDTTIHMLGCPIAEARTLGLMEE